MSQSKEFKVPGITRDEFIDTYGPERLKEVPTQYIISWARVVYILNGWQGDVDDGCSN